MSVSEVSHGRGGVGNINPDSTEYLDGAIVRKGEIGSHGDGAYSTGRGGAANIADKDIPPAPRVDKDFVPQAAVRQSVDGDYHTGRGGAANVVHLPNPDGEKGVKSPNQGLAEKLKYKLFAVFKK
ncbi:hypothetical protein GGS21DRAFT_493250 [Xylaria nigripes]|nr:hypothetical protein GGS21DRAFT_493250 [Xylaria nigripes]